jgi:hypothetical protein
LESKDEGKVNTLVGLCQIIGKLTFMHSLKTTGKMLVNIGVGMLNPT